MTAPEFVRIVLEILGAYTVAKWIAQYFGGMAMTTRIDARSMTLDDYEELATSTAIYPERGSLMGLLYVALKLAGEAGEVADKVAKILRDNNGEVTPEIRAKLLLELGDVQWYIPNMAFELQSTLEEVCALNLEKLQGRTERGTLHGDGDNR